MMPNSKKILIIYPHFPPSNLAGVHRARLFAQHLPSFGWQPTILTVHENYYEEKLDRNLEKLLPTELVIEKVNAFKNTKPRIFGDIGIRSFFQLYKKAKELILSNNYDFLYIPIPSFYCALLGRLLNGSTRIKYGIDYIDPWVHVFPGSNKLFSRHWLSTIVAKFLEPIAVKNASLITGVAESYYTPVFQRNQSLKNVVSGAMPYGGEALDHDLLKTLNLQSFLFSKKNDKVQIVYAGAMLPKAYLPLENIFKSIANNIEDFKKVEFHFIGTGFLANDSNSYNIKPLAEKYGLWHNIVFEYPARIPYLDVLVHLSIADAVFVLGSTEAHYTPSKIYQAILSKKPIFAVLHSKSSASNVIKESNAGKVLCFDGEADTEKIRVQFLSSFLEFIEFKNSFNYSQVNQNLFKEYSAKEVTNTLSKLLNKVVV